MTTVITLARGSHEPPADDCGNPQRCLFEWYNWLTRQVHTDACPPGVSPVLHQFGMSLNDLLPDGKRQELVKFLPNGTSPLAGTAGDGLDEARGYLALDWLVRTNLPAWLDLVPSLADDAAAVRSGAVISDMDSARASGIRVRAAAAKAAATGDATWAAARDAARAATGAATGDAAWAALAPTVARLQDSAIALYHSMAHPDV